MPSIPENPTRDDALAAVATLKELQSEFPFQDGVSMSVGLSGMITPVARGAFPITPMHAFTAPVPGSGKSFECDLIAALATGKIMPVISVVNGNEEETAKRLHAALCTGQPLICLDNVDGDLGGKDLCQAITQQVIQIRPFGKNTELIDIEARGLCIFGNGNNMTLVGIDIIRRVLTGRLDPRMEQPETREFKGNPVKTVLADRGKYIAACLIICRAYAIAGRPGKAAPLASFEGWSDTVRSALIWLGEPDPAESIKNSRADDPVRARRQNLLTAWAKVIGTGSGNSETVSQVIHKAEHHHDAEEREALFNAILAVAKIEKRDVVDIDRARLGMWLSKNKEVLVGSLRFQRQKNENDDVARWYVEDMRGFAGDYDHVVAE